MLLWIAMPVVAAPVDLEIEAPEPLRKLLADNLGPAFATHLHDQAAAPILTPGERRQVTELLATEGYFSPALAVEKSTDGLLHLVVKPGPRARIERVDVAFSGDIVAAGEPNTERIAALRHAWPLTVGKPFRDADWQAAKQGLLADLRATDYAAATLTESRAEVDPEQASVKLSVTYDSGPRFTFGKLEISGLDSYNRSVVDRLNPLRQGERYSQERLLDLQRGLQNTPYFTSVFVDIVPDPQNPHDVPIMVRVVEAKPKRLSFGLGYGSNSGAHGSIGFRDANILDRGWQLSSGIRIDRIDRLIFAEINLPPDAKDYRDTFGVLVEHNDNQGLILNQAGIGAARARIKGAIETKVSVNALRQQRRVAEGERTQSTTVSLNWSWTWRAVDNILDPRTGQVVNVQLGGASKALLSDQTFLRSVIRAQKYWTVFGTDVFSLRGEFGWTAASSRVGIPEAFLFRAGGAQSVRGYAYQSIGVQEAGATVGGRYLATASAEYVRWFSEKWGSAVFVDAGRASDSGTGLFPLKAGYGLGARWRSPAGPLAFDLAYGAAEHKWRPVFSIQIAF